MGVRRKLYEGGQNVLRGGEVEIHGTGTNEGAELTKVVLLKVSIFYYTLSSLK